MQIIDWNAVFDRLKLELGAETDKDLGDWIGATPGQISKARSGTGPEDEELPSHAKFIALDHCGYFKLLRDPVLALLTKKARAKVLAFERRRTQAIASRAKQNRAGKKQ